jgi:membrane associated rhomboid family serine protease
VAYFAHIGGFVAGALTALIYRRRRQVYYWWYS